MDLLNSSKAILNPNVGVCYSFNYRPQTVDAGETMPSASILAGEDNSLELELNLESKLYLGNALSPKLGVNVVINEPDHYPILSKQGIQNHFRQA